jgi:hypothetical protein
MESILVSLSPPQGFRGHVGDPGGALPVRARSPPVGACLAFGGTHPVPDGA